ncbi:hypothetical protein Y1Q_0021771 [Alligator mississippiensis]|uniref:Uncharacterized protein n=1 Tax=Alligator mississippiensis TaxID=8496 RepID=A0A151PB90_ALLMI|nr:hypothetical protein Y1Q_0021771 [Alligator mississippiensis]
MRLQSSTRYGTNLKRFLSTLTKCIKQKHASPSCTVFYDPLDCNLGWNFQERLEEQNSEDGKRPPLI